MNFIKSTYVIDFFIHCNSFVLLKLICFIFSSFSFPFPSFLPSFVLPTLPAPFLLSPSFFFFFFKDTGLD